MLAAVVKYVPEIFAFCSKSYTCQPTIMFNEHSIISATGTQQGDPLGALLFCITLQPVLEQVTSELNIGYLDDITLGGIAADVGRDVEMIRVEAGRLGLMLNDAKCELIYNGFNECSHPAFSGFIRIDSDDATLLGSPLCSGNGLTAALTKKVMTYNVLCHGCIWWAHIMLFVLLGIASVFLLLCIFLGLPDASIMDCCIALIQFLEMVLFLF